MLSFLPAPVLGVITFVLFTLNLIFWIIPLYAVALLKLVIPVRGWRQMTGNWLVAVAEMWISCNNLIAKLHKIEWDIRGLESLRRNEWYLVTCNHQAWADVFVIQRVFNRRIPFQKFFIKKELIWVPLLGLAWWAMDLPFMHRHSKEALKKNPALRGQDLETTRRACEHFRHTPTTVLNFVEGTRFTQEKHAQQQSPYRHLLNPKAGGVAFVLSALDGMITSVLDVTIVYPHQDTNFWDLLSGRVPRIVVDVRERSIPVELQRGDYLNDDAFKEKFQEWISAMWLEKDALMVSLIEETGG